VKIDRFGLGILFGPDESFYVRKWGGGSNPVSLRKAKGLFEGDARSISTNNVTPIRWKTDIISGSSLKHTANAYQFTLVV
jgi:hypothetical protein